MKTADKLRNSKNLAEEGRTLICPKCNGEVDIISLNWVALACLHCKYPTEKHKWIVKEDKK